MTQVLKKLKVAARTATNTIEHLQRASAEQAERISRSREAAKRRVRVHIVKALRKCNKRTQRAVRGLEAIDVLVQTSEVQELLRLSRRIDLWSGYLHIPSHPDGEGGHDSSMTSEFYLALSLQGVCLRDSTSHGGREDLSESTELFFPYQGDPSDRFSRLAHLATSSGCNPAHETDIFESLKAVSSEAPTDILFQVLADCASPRMLSKYFLRAIGRR